MRISRRELAAVAGAVLPSVRALNYEIERRRTDWTRYARPDQLIPDDILTGEKIFWLILAGRGYGKTRTGAETVRYWHKQGERYINLIGATADDARDIMIEGESGILACCAKYDRPVYKRSERKLEWPNGAVSLIFTADEPERLRGKQHGKLWADELAAWRYAEAWDQAQMGLRLGTLSQAVVTTTPKPTKLVKDLAADESTHITRGTTYDNAKNLSKAFLSKVVKKYQGTRLGRQELEAVILDDNPNALWKRAWLDASRTTHELLKKRGIDFVRIVVGVDPAVTSNVRSDLTGIVVAALGTDGEYYVLEDASCLQSPANWAKTVIRVYNRHAADRVVGEVNNGGDLVEHTLRTVKGDPETDLDADELDGSEIPYTKVHASRGKAKRAEPVAALWEQGRAHMVGSHGSLEDECCDFDPTIEAEKQPSPDRMDAMVWAITELMDDAGPQAGIFMKTR